MSTENQRHSGGYVFVGEAMASEVIGVNASDQGRLLGRTRYRPPSQLAD